MALIDSSNIGQQLLDVPFPDMVKSMGLAIAEAQYELDLVGMRLAQMMSGTDYPNPAFDPNKQEDATTNPKALSSKVTFGTGDDGEALELSLLELGFTPTFYQFVDTLIEVKISISMAYERSYRRKSTDVNISAVGGFFLGFGGAKMKVSTVSAAYAAKYNYSAEGASLLRTKLVPVPTPHVLEERIRRLVERST